MDVIIKSKNKTLNRFESNISFMRVLFVTVRKPIKYWGDKSASTNLNNTKPYGSIKPNPNQFYSSSNSLHIIHESICPNQSIKLGLIIFIHPLKLTASLPDGVIIQIATFGFLVKKQLNLPRV